MEYALDVSPNVTMPDMVTDAPYELVVEAAESPVSDMEEVVEPGFVAVAESVESPESAESSGIGLRYNS